VTSDRAVLLVGFGGPEREQDVRPFIEDVVRGRGVPAERIDLVVEQYKQIGGVSPYNRLLAQQASALETKLVTANEPVRVYVGMLHSKPSIAEAMQKMVADGFTGGACIIMAPHRTEASFEKYVKAIGENGVRLKIAEAWHTDRLFVQAIQERIGQKLRELPAAELPKTRIIFTAHSVPQQMSDSSGYAAQIEETGLAVFNALRAKEACDGIDWVVGYQSRSGPPSQRWLEPDVAVRIAEAKASGRKHVVVAPIGFLVDHVEVLYDLDVLAAQAAAKEGINMLRAGTVGDHPAFIELLMLLTRQNISSISRATAV
jgi:ferrochelatase